MPIEERRREIMAKGAQWGDSWPAGVNDASAISGGQIVTPKASLAVSSSLPPSTINASTILKSVSPNEELSDLQLADMDLLTDPTASGSNLSTHSIPRNSETTNKSSSSTFVSSKDWEFSALHRRSRRFHKVPRYHYTCSNLSNIIKDHEKTGVPMIIEGWHESEKWPTDSFNVDWLRKHGHQTAAARNVCDWTDRDIMLPDLIDNMRASPKFALPGEKERLYGKDGECPQEWAEWLSSADLIPSSLLFNGSDDVLKYMPESAKVQTLMYYLGIGDTFTPFHKDLCGSSGQNLMCYTEESGSSFWFMTEGSSAPAVADYLHGLGHELDLESHVLTVEELEKTPFDVYIAEQKLGDLVLVPSRSCHQVVNRGGITVKTSWSRMTVDNLSTALYHELPVYRRVCRPEIYRVKTNVSCALLQYTIELEHCSKIEEYPEKLDIATKLWQLHDLFDDIITEEHAEDHPSIRRVPQSDAQMDSHFACDFCGADIFQSFFECSRCTDNNDKPTAIGDGIIVCPYCYVEGRTCRCGVMEAVQTKPSKDLKQLRDRAKKALEDSGIEDGREHTYLSSVRSGILSRGHLGVFQAACNLQRSRLKNKVVRNCCLRRDGSLCRVPGSVLPCKLCHMGRCFSHILENGLLHSSEAITLYHSDKTGLLWHQQHSEARSKREQAWSMVKQAEETGSRPDMNHMLAYLATKFVTCKPIKPAHTRHGWYDKNVLVARMPAYALDATRPRNVKTSTEIHNADGSVNSCSNSLNSANVEFEPLTNDDHMHVLSPVAVAVDPSSTRPYVRASTPVAISSSNSKKRTRAVLDCVYISADRAAVGKRSSINPPSSTASSSIPAALARVEDEEMSDDDDDVPLKDLVCPSSETALPSSGLALAFQRAISSSEVIEVINPPVYDVAPVAASSEEGPLAKKARINIKTGDLFRPEMGHVRSLRSKGKVPPRRSAITRSSTARTQPSHVSANHPISGSSRQERQTLSLPNLSLPPPLREGADGLVQAFSQSIANDTNAQRRWRSHTSLRVSSACIQDDLDGQRQSLSLIQSRASSTTLSGKDIIQGSSENELPPTENKAYQDELGVKARRMQGASLQQDGIEKMQRVLQSSHDNDQTFQSDVQEQQEHLQTNLQGYTDKFWELKNMIQEQDDAIEQVHEEVRKQAQYPHDHVLEFESKIECQQRNILKLRDDMQGIYSHVQTLDDKIRGQRIDIGKVQKGLQGCIDRVNDRVRTLESKVGLQKDTIGKVENELGDSNDRLLQLENKIQKLNETILELKQSRKEAPVLTDLLGPSSAEMLQIIRGHSVSRMQNQIGALQEEVAYLRSAPPGLGQVMMFSPRPYHSGNDRYHRDQELFPRHGNNYGYQRRDGFKGRNFRYRPDLLPCRETPYHRPQSYQHPRDRPHFTQYRGGRLPPTEPRTKMTTYRECSRSPIHEPRSDSGNLSTSCSTSHEPRPATRNWSPSCSTSREPRPTAKNRSSSCSTIREPRSDTRDRLSSCSPTGVYTTNTQFDSSANTAITRHKEKSLLPTRPENDPQDWEDDYEQDPDVMGSFSSPRPGRSDVRKMATLTDTYASVPGNDSNRIYGGSSAVVLRDDWDHNPWK